MNRNGIWTRAVTLMVSALCLLSLTGCFGVDGSFHRLRDSVVRGAASGYQVEAEFGIGSLMLGLARKVISLSDDSDADVALGILQQVSKVQVGVYSLDHSLVTGANPSCRQRLVHLLESLMGEGYDAIVRNYEDTRGSLILVRSDPRHLERVREIIVVSLEQQELHLVQLRGNVNGIVELVAREHELSGVDKVVEQAH
ncbi:MAG: hypothetical protein ABQ298_16300 [Puniceicoccaceae bacterium]